MKLSYQVLIAVVAVSAIAVRCDNAMMQADEQMQGAGVEPAAPLLSTDECLESDGRWHPCDYLRKKADPLPPYDPTWMTPQGSGQTWRPTNDASSITQCIIKGRWLPCEASPTAPGKNGECLSSSGKWVSCDP